jgi:hypothetical protein
MERETGIEPATSSLGSWRSTAELLPLTSKAPRLTLIRATQNAVRRTYDGTPPDATLGEVIQIIILGELICKECSFATVCRQLDCRRSVHTIRSRGWHVIAQENYSRNKAPEQFASERGEC